MIEELLEQKRTDIRRYLARWQEEMDKTVFYLEQVKENIARLQRQDKECVRKIELFRQMRKGIFSESGDPDEAAQHSVDIFNEMAETRRQANAAGFEEK